MQIKMSIIVIIFGNPPTKGCIRLAAASEQFYQLLAHGRWFSPVSSITKTDRHDIAETGDKHNKSNQIKSV